MRKVKSPKLYFYDSGLLCYLLGVDSADHLSIHASRGAVFEGYVLSEIKKILSNLGLSSTLYFWRDSNGNEIDGVVELNGKLIALEIKSTSTFRSDLLKNLRKWQTLTSSNPEHGYLVYSGEESHQLLVYNVIPWQALESLFLDDGVNGLSRS